MHKSIIGIIVFIVLIGGFLFLNNQSSTIETNTTDDVLPLNNGPKLTDFLVFLLDSSDSFYQSIGGFSMPETLFVDSDGVIRVHKRGPMRLSEMREKVESILTDNKKEENRDTVPDIALSDYDGNIITQNDFPGKILVINSWATWCPFCVNELLDFVELQKEFQDEIVVIAIDRAESLQTAKEYTDNFILK